MAFNYGYHLGRKTSKYLVEEISNIRSESKGDFDWSSKVLEGLASRLWEQGYSNKARTALRAAYGDFSKIEMKPDTIVSKHMNRKAQIAKRALEMEDYPLAVKIYKTFPQTSDTVKEASDFLLKKDKPKEVLELYHYIGPMFLGEEREKIMEALENRRTK